MMFDHRGQRKGDVAQWRRILNPPHRRQRISLVNNFVFRRGAQHENFHILQAADLSQTAKRGGPVLFQHHMHVYPAETKGAYTGASGRSVARYPRSRYGIQIQRGLLDGEFGVRFFA